MTAFKNRVLVTGGCGFIGTNLVRRLNKAGREIIILDNLSSGQKENVQQFCQELIEGDILDSNLVNEITKNIHTIIHLAAHTNVIKSIENPENDFNANVLGTFNLLRAAVASGVKKFVFASTGAVLGEVVPPAHEGIVPRPLSPYGASKMACEGYLSAFAHCYGIQTVSLRFSNVYGPFSSHKTSVIAKFIGLLKNGKNLLIYGDGKQTRDFLYVDDLIDAIIVAEKVDLYGEIFQIASGVETDIFSLAKLIKKLAGKDVEIIFAGKRKGEVYKNYACIDKAKNFLNFHPKVSLEEGIKKTLSWFENGGS